MPWSGHGCTVVVYGNCSVYRVPHMRRVQEGARTLRVHRCAARTPHRTMPHTTMQWHPAHRTMPHSVQCSCTPHRCMPYNTGHQHSPTLQLHGCTNPWWEKPQVGARPHTTATTVQIARTAQHFFTNYFRVMFECAIFLTSLIPHSILIVLYEPELRCPC